MINMLKFFTLLILSYLGLAAGVIVSNFTKEELKAGRKYFILLKLIIFAAVFYYFLIYLTKKTIIALALSIGVFIAAYKFEKMLKHVNTNLFYYGFFAVVLFEVKDFAPVIATMIFLFGMASASAQFTKKSVIKNLIAALLNNLIYIVLGIALSLFF